MMDNATQDRVIALLEERVGALKQENTELQAQQPPQTKCVSTKYGSGSKVTLAITEADLTPAWFVMTP